MNTNRTKLALRRQSIRTLTPSELRIAHGGKGTGTGTRYTKTQVPPPPPPPTKLW